MLKSVLLGVTAFVVYAVVDLVALFWGIPRQSAVGLSAVASLTIKNELWWTVCVLMIALAYTTLKLRRLKKSI
ncbi:MAG TPA: hypothetical protein VGV15_05725 [Terriglobales bacterium]|nr:hypothetical protein [Terriglobales bacterium]